MGNITFTPADAGMLIALITSAGLVNVATQYIKRSKMSDVQKFCIAALLSAFMGGLTAYSAGKLGYSMSLMEAATVILSASTGFYHAVFKRFGWDKSLFPDSSETPPEETK